MLRKIHEYITAVLSKWGLYEYIVVPLRLTNAPDSFQYFMNDAMQSYLDKFVFVYLDDLIIYSKLYVNMWPMFGKY